MLDVLIDPHQPRWNSSCPAPFIHEELDSLDEPDQRDKGLSDQRMLRVFAALPAHTQPGVPVHQHRPQLKFPELPC